MQSTIDYSIKEGEKVIADIKTEVSGSTGGLGAALRAAQKKTNEILTEVVERHRAAAGAGDGSPPSATSGDPNATTPQKYSCARCGRSYLHQATLVRHQVTDEL